MTRYLHRGHAAPITLSKRVKIQTETQPEFLSISILEMPPDITARSDVMTEGDDREVPAGGDCPLLAGTIVVVFALKLGTYFVTTAAPRTWPRWWPPRCSFPSPATSCLRSPSRACFGLRNRNTLIFGWR
jgi:hypothetical protein